MLKKIIVGILIINGLAGLVLAQVSPAGSTSQKDFIKNEVIRIGENRRIKRLVLNDGTKLKGFIKEIRSDSFVLVNGYRIANSKVIAVDRSNSAREIRFDQVSEIKPYRNIAAGIVAGIVVGTIIVAIVGAALVAIDAQLLKP
jgi:hypothetical protein